MKLSELKRSGRLARSINLISKKCFKELTDRKYFSQNPQKVLNRWHGYGIIIFGLSFLFLFVVSSLIGVDYFLKFNLAISLWVSGLLFLIFARFMPKKSKKGADAYWKILGFKDFIKTAEKYRAQFYERENIFEEYLPYAILFGLTDKWAKAFEGIYQNSPSWYEGSVAKSFSVVAFTDSLNHSLSAFSSSAFRGGGAVSGSSGLGGGGFSGGGFGGGGGGSW